MQNNKKAQHTTANSNANHVKRRNIQLYASPELFAPIVCRMHTIIINGTNIVEMQLHYLLWRWLQLDMCKRETTKSLTQRMLKSNMQIVYKYEIRKQFYINSWVFFAHLPLILLVRHPYFIADSQCYLGPLKLFSQSILLTTLRQKRIQLRMMKKRFTFETTNSDSLMFMLELNDFSIEAVYLIHFRRIFP